MIDLHSHILPGIDDGSQSFEESLNMARLAVESGVTVMAVTPHCMNDRSKEVREKVLVLRDILKEAEIPLKLCMGMEIFGTEYTSRLLREKRLFTLNKSKYPLVEFSFSTSGESETEILHDMIWSGYRPLVAHPERYDFIRENPELTNIWRKMGCLFQINRGSLMGRFGSDIQNMAHSLVKRNFADIVASDAHSERMRTPYLKDVYDLITEKYSYDMGDKLFYYNPKKILKNEDVLSSEPDWYR